MDLKKDLICKICEKILNEPITLPCLCAYICNSHVEDLVRKKKTSIKCQFCEKEWCIPKKGFEKSEVVQNFIKKNGHLNKDEIKIKIDMESSLENLETVYQDFKLKLREFALFKYEHYENIRRNIDIRRESLIEKINIISQQMIARVEISEENFIKIDYLKTLEFNYERERKTFEDLFRNPNFNVEILENSKIEQNKKLKEIQDKLDNIYSIKSDLKNFKFESNFNFDNDLFGYLDLNEKFQNLITCYFNSRDIYVWDLKSHSIIKTLSGHLDGVWSLAIFQNTKLISGSRDKTIRIWNLQNNECIQILRGHEDEVWIDLFLF